MNLSDQTMRNIRNQIKNHIHDTIKIKEQCGVIIQIGNKIEIREIKNISNQNQEIHYIIDLKELEKKTKDTDLFQAKAKNKFIGFWHTHPKMASIPSQTDFLHFLNNKDYYIYSVLFDTLSRYKLDKFN